MQNFMKIGEKLSEWCYSGIKLIFFMFANLAISNSLGAPRPQKGTRWLIIIYHG